MAFGTAVAWGRAPPHIIEAFFKAFSKLNEYRVIFSFKGSKKFLETRKKPPQHVRIVEWAPQLDILSHSKTRVFLTHGGLKRWEGKDYKKIIITSIICQCQRIALFKDTNACNANFCRTKP